MLSEKIYTLRRKNGLSQEQLAERIGVSRQAVSKWEGGLSVPELDNLRSLSECFHITLDELTQEESAPSEPLSAQAPPQSAPPSSISRPGILLCLLAGLFLILFGVLTLARPSAAEALNASSAVTLNGSGILLSLILFMMAAGIFLILKKK